MSAYKTSKYLAESAGSVLGQRLRPAVSIELIIGVDHDPQCLDVAREIARRDPRVTLLWMKKNVGTYRTMNTCLTYARGAYISVLDSDDVSLPGRFMTAMRAFAEDPDLKMVGSWFYDVDEALRIRKLMKMTNVMTHSSWTVKKSVYDELGGYKELRCGADYDFLVRVRKNNHKVLCMQEPCVKHRGRPGSLSGGNPATRRNSPERNRANAETKREADAAEGEATRLTLRPAPHRVEVRAAP